MSSALTPETRIRVRRRDGVVIWPPPPDRSRGAPRTGPLAANAPARTAPARGSREHNGGIGATEEPKHGARQRPEVRRRRSWCIRSTPTTAIARRRIARSGRQQRLVDELV